MQYSKPMVELVYEIRRRVPPDLKPSVKLANPELFDDLIEHYHLNATTIAKALIKELLMLAGEGWSDALTRPTRGPEAGERHVVKVYRGQTRLEPAEREPSRDSAPAEQKKAKMIYRGRVVG